MLTPLSLELFAQDTIRERLQRAHQDALAAQLPRTSPATLSFRLDLVARQSLANGLQALAIRLDPSLLCEPDLVVLSSR